MEWSDDKTWDNSVAVILDVSPRPLRGGNRYSVDFISASSTCSIRSIKESRNSSASLSLVFAVKDGKEWLEGTNTKIAVTEGFCSRKPNLAWLTIFSIIVVAFWIQRKRGLELLTKRCKRSAKSAQICRLVGKGRHRCSFVCEFCWVLRQSMSFRSHCLYYLFERGETITVGCRLKFKSIHGFCRRFAQLFIPRNEWMNESYWWTDSNLVRVRDNITGAKIKNPKARLFPLKKGGENRNRRLWSLRV